MTAGLVHASPARTPEACSSQLPAVARPGVRGRPAAPPVRAPPRPRRPARERPPPRGLQVGPASRSRSLRTSEQQRRSQPGAAVTYRRLMVAQRLSPATVLTNRARQLGASPGSPAGPYSQPFKHRRARPAGIASRGRPRAPPSASSAPSGACGGGDRARGRGAP